MAEAQDNIITPTSFFDSHILLIYVLVCMVLTAVIFLWVRSRRIEEFNRILDREYRINYGRRKSNVASTSSQHFREDVKDDSILDLATFVSAADILYHYGKIDPGLLDSIHKAHGEKAFRSYRELSHHVDEVAARGNENWRGMVNYYKGYFGEKVFAAYLEGQGFKVERAPYGQEGWDSLINGEKWQIKSGTDPEHIERHRERFPDVKVLTVSEHAGRFANDEMVYALPISGQQLEDVTKDTLHGVRDLDEAGIDFPVVAFLASCYRNALRYERGEVKLLDATKTTVVDVASVGIGGYAGAEIGSWVGEFFGETAAAWLECFGGRLGAFLLREGIDYVRGYKYRTLKQYISDMESKLSNIPVLYVDSLNRKRKYMESCANENRPSGIRYVLWPNLSDMTKSRVCNRYLEECRRYREYEGHLRTEMSQGGAGNKIIVAKIFRNEKSFPLLDLKYENTKRELSAINNKILDEKKRLGIGV